MHNGHQTQGWQKTSSGGKGPVLRYCDSAPFDYPSWNQQRGYCTVRSPAGRRYGGSAPRSPTVAGRTLCRCPCEVTAGARRLVGDSRRGEVASNVC